MEKSATQNIMENIKVEFDSFIRAIGLEPIEMDKKENVSSGSEAMGQ